MEMTCEVMESIVTTNTHKSLSSVIQSTPEYRIEIQNVSLCNLFPHGGSISLLPLYITALGIVRQKEKGALPTLVYLTGDQLVFGIMGLSALHLSPKKTLVVFHL